MKTTLILVAGGVGSRMQSAIPKQFLPLKNKPIVLHSFEVFEKLEAISEIVVVVEKDKRSLFTSHSKTIKFADPGTLRQESVQNGLKQVAQDTDLVLTHDSARPFVTQEMVESVIAAAQKHGAATVGMPVKYTVKETDSEGIVQKTLNRDLVWEIQTPQAVKKDILIKGFEKINREKLVVTDDVSVAEHMNCPVQMVHGAYNNIKITTPEDLKLAELLL